MSYLLRLPASVPPRVLTPASRLRFHWRASEMDLRALTDQGLADFGRAGAVSGLTDFLGSTSLQAGFHEPAFTCYDLDGNGIFEWLTWVLGASDVVFWPYLAPVETSTVLADFVERGTISTANARVLHIGKDDNTGVRFYLDSTGTAYRANFHDGTTLVSSTLSAAPTVGQRVRLRTTLRVASGVVRVQIFQTIGTGTESSAAESSTANWFIKYSDARLYVNSVGATNKGAIAVRSLKVAPGLQSRATMEAML